MKVSKASKIRYSIIQIKRANDLNLYPTDPSSKLNLINISNYFSFPPQPQIPFHPLHIFPSQNSHCHPMASSSESTVELE